jgi:hypothetical protein
VVLFLVQKCGGKSPYMCSRYLVFITQKIPGKTVYQYNTILHMVHAILEGGAAMTHL